MSNYLLIVSVVLTCFLDVLLLVRQFGIEYLIVIEINTVEASRNCNIWDSEDFLWPKFFVKGGAPLHSIYACILSHVMIIKIRIHSTWLI